MSWNSIHLFKWPPQSQDNGDLLQSDEFQTSIFGKSGGKVFLLLLGLRMASGKLFMGVLYLYPNYFSSSFGYLDDFWVGILN